jgi:hypothetical protein
MIQSLGQKQIGHLRVVAQKCQLVVSHSSTAIVLEGFTLED